MNILCQPYGGYFGDVLINQINTGRYDRIDIMSAFAKNSGVLRLQNTLLNYKSTTQGTINAFIGIDAHGTSYEALVNLFNTVDNLYVIHDNNSSATFHSKVYYLSSSTINDWLAVGSNNLTCGGLWTNYENALYFDVTANDQAVVNDIKATIQLYENPTCAFSKRINSITDIDALLNANLVNKEYAMRMNRASASQNTQSQQLFGSRGRVVPPQQGRTQHNATRHTAQPVQAPGTALPAVNTTLTNETMWFETSVLTGGSRNILDLSKTGRMVSGSAQNTRYWNNNATTCVGDSIFFDINPSNTNAVKDVTVNYNGIDYVGCTIKYGASNNSWRIQLKGVDSHGNALQQLNVLGWMMHKAIVLEKINTSYYSMSIVDETNIPQLEANSIFVARNGHTSTSKRFGLLSI